MLIRGFLHRLARAVANYPKLSLGLVIGYVCASVLEIIPVIEIVTDFIVILSYLLILRYISQKKKIGQPL